METTIDYNAAELYLIEYMRSKGQRLNKGEIKDFTLFGDETAAEVEQAANDFLSDLATEKAEYLADRRANQYDTDSLDMSLNY